MKNRYIDANIFIQGILRNDNNCKNIILKIANKEFKGITSVLSWDEITFIIEKFLGRELAEIEGKKFFNLPNFMFIEVKKDIIIKAQKLFEQYNLKPRNAIHAATAISLNIEEIVSEDTDFDRVQELKRIDPRNV